MLTCPWCGAVEPNEMLLSNNHWVRTEPLGGYDWCASHGMCIAMSLTRGHVDYSVERLTTGPRDRFNQSTGTPLRGEAREVERESLARYIARATEVWVKSGDTDWLDEARRVLAETAPPGAPVHHEVPESEDADLFGGVA